MKTLFALTKLELFFSIRRSGFLIYYLLLALLLFLMANVMGGAFSGVQAISDGVRLNAPAAVQAIMGSVSLITTFLVSSLSGMGALRDFRYNSFQLTYSYPVSRFNYVLGKFLGIYLSNLLLFTAPLLGFAVGCEMPWLNRSAFQSFEFLTYWNVFVQLFSINILFLSAGFFTLGLLFRNIIVNWIAIIALYLMYFLGGHYFDESATHSLGVLLDPYGLIGTMSVSVGQSAEERNSSEIAVTGLYLWNRLLWLGVGFLTLGIALWRFRFRQANATFRIRLFSSKTNREVGTEPISFITPGYSKVSGSAFATSTFFNQLKMECRQLLKNVYLYIILIAAMVFLYFSSSVLSGEFEASSYPITRLIATTFGSVINIFVILIILVFSGEAIWRDMQHRIAGIVYSMPASRTVRILAKTTALYLLVLAILGLVIISGIIYQSAQGYYHFELPLYFQYIYGYLGVKYLFYCVLAVALQMLAGSKFQGYAAFGVLYLFSRFFAYDLFRHGIFVPGHTPQVSYSDLIGFNGSFYPFFVYLVYWMLAATLFWKIGIRFFPVSEGESYKERWLRFKVQHASGYSRQSWLMAGSMLILGGFIFYNTDFLNDNYSAKRLNNIQASYEKNYGKLRTEPQLSISRIDGNIALMPTERKMNADMKLTLVNKTSSVVTSIYFNQPDVESVRDIKADISWKELFVNKENNFSGYQFANPVQPGDTVTLTYRFESKPNGFTDAGLSTLVQPNGTFMNSTAFIPSIGYDASRELTGNELRKTYGLAPKPYAAPLNDKLAQQSNFLGQSADRIWLKLTLSTEQGQTAIAPGYLQKQWNENGRSYFSYEMDQPAINYFSIQSGKYAVRQEKYIVPGDSAQQPVALSIYYHPQHAYNLDVMMQAMKDGLNYYSTSFGPYQYRQLRVVEFPESSFAQSFANTIAFSENVGFLTDLRAFEKMDSQKDLSIEAEDLPSNFTYFITLHEVAHQWWAHQILPASNEGANFLSESMSQYSAVMAVKNRYGATGARKLMDYYSFRYLSARSHENLEERPLQRVMDQQYIYYNKGICIMYSLQKYLGEDLLNATLKDFVRENAYRERPYVTTDMLVGKLKAAAPDSMKYLVSDGLEKIVVYENELKSASYKLDPETLEYTVDVLIKGKKITYNEKGKPVETAMADFIELGILDSEGRQVGSQIMKLHAGENKLQFTTTRRPATLMLNPDSDLLEMQFNKANRKIDVVKG